jgi:DivIVA domain-containing protein
MGALERVEIIRSRVGLTVFRMGTGPDFAVVPRGYDRAEVDFLIDRLDGALTTDNSAFRALVAQEARAAQPQVTTRGYDRAQVDDYLTRTAAMLAVE